MKLIATSIPDVLLLEPAVHGDHRGFFMETWRESQFDGIFADSQYAASGDLRFVQDNHSKSGAGILRGLHYQLRKPQGKLVRVVAGEIFDVAVDMRRQSPTFGKWVGERLSAENRRQLWVPPGFAHGFLVLSESAEMVYKCTGYYAADDEYSLQWNDPTVGINWPTDELSLSEPILSDKDRNALSFEDAPSYQA